MVLREPLHKAALPHARVSQHEQLDLVYPRGWLVGPSQAMPMVAAASRRQETLHAGADKKKWDSAGAG